ncbi:Uncharacterised protein [Klebsiella pneumoniae]|nr:Uncharacterised protein [Klebsiella pneumoniae]
MRFSIPIWTYSFHSSGTAPLTNDELVKVVTFLCFQKKKHNSTLVIAYTYIPNHYNCWINYVKKVFPAIFCLSVHELRDEDKRGHTKAYGKTSP